MSIRGNIWFTKKCSGVGGNISFDVWWPSGSRFFKLKHFKQGWETGWLRMRVKNDHGSETHRNIVLTWGLWGFFFSFKRAILQFAKIPFEFTVFKKGLTDLIVHPTKSSLDPLVSVVQVHPLTHQINKSIIPLLLASHTKKTVLRIRIKLIWTRA